MRRRDVAGFLAALERRLDCEPERRRRIVEEIEAHLGDLVAEARAEGADQATAEARAVARFGSPRRLARGLGRRTRVPRGARIALALGALGLTGGLAYAQLRAAAPVVAVSAGNDPRMAGTAGTVTTLGRQQLVALDPATLRIARRGAQIASGQTGSFGLLSPDGAFVAPDGSRVAVVVDATLYYYDLDDLRPLGSTRLGTRPAEGPTRPSQRAGRADVIRTGAWLGGNVLALVQHQAPPYASRVTSRAIVVIDPATGRVLSRRPVALEGAVIGSTRTPDRLVVAACNAGRVSLLDVATDGSSAVIALGLPCSGNFPFIALAAGGSTVAVVQAGHPLVQVDLVTGQVTRTRLHGTLGWSAIRNPFLRAVWWHDRLIVTGMTFVPVVPGPARPWKPGGVTSIDPHTGTATLLSREGTWVLPTRDRLVVGGQGLGLTAYSPAGRRVWHADGKRTVVPFAVGDTIFAPRSVKRHTIVDSYSAQTGRHLASRFQPGEGTRPFAGAIQSTTG